MKTFFFCSMAQEPFRFPPQYYEICSSNGRRKRTKRWFCNTTPSPQATDPYDIQNDTVSSSEDSPQKIDANRDLNNNSDPVENIESPVDNEDKDASYCPESDISSEISSGSPRLICTPPSSENSDTEECLGMNSEAKEARSSHHQSVENAEKISPSFANQESEIGHEISTSHNPDDVVISKKSVFCAFCESIVQNFPRHLERNHKSEHEVQALLAVPPGSKKRKEILVSLRKKGHYLISSQKTKPMRKGDMNTNYLPCEYCLGFYSSRNLWRHKKTCHKNPTQGSSQKNCKSMAQNYLLRHIKVDTKLRNEVFPRMRADEVSLTAKKDPLICAFGARYLKIHREKHFALVTSRKMREIARLLIEMRKIKTSIKDLLSALKPENYDVLVQATENISRYDKNSQRFASPTLALNMGTTLKQCCNIALVLTIKKSFPSVQTANFESDLRTLIQLIEGNWKFDVSSQAANDLNIQKWNKVSLVPLAGDLKLLKNCLLKKAEEAILNLNTNKDAKSYLNLLETIYCRLVLLNRRRPGELQRLSLETFRTAMQNNNSQHYEEFSEAISESEKLLMNKFKRIVMRGKRGRGVPVLISLDVQEHFDIILSYRDKFFKSSNDHLFGNPFTDTPIIGYKVLRKYAILSKAKNPDALTCTRLRKHLATLTQLFNMNENDMEQLASFMGHTLGIHRSSYRLPDDVYQTARISKLLILMEKGEAGQFKGKSLDDIDLNLEEDLVEPENNIEERTRELSEENENDDTVEDISEITEKEEPQKKKKDGKRVLIPWTTAEKKVVLEYFKNHIRNERPPKRGECEDLISKNKEILKNRNWLKIKVFVQNQYKRK
ncbi:uncharacterized protein LOC123311961 [Coccinella septempunctata]|uniref:uncharacterized protein LOC123311961 n=1 Tax=Coccinella septempunctata TaxID=41139 RepID=UPI001D064A5C|nr:uncharacterized protein LOC123311961 [Coccinella septempunctata]